jgi:uncharacterized protein (TIGR04255 family)
MWTKSLIHRASGTVARPWLSPLGRERLHAIGPKGGTKTVAAGGGSQAFLVTSRRARPAHSVPHLAPNSHYQQNAGSMGRRSSPMSSGALLIPRTCGKVVSTKCLEGNCARMAGWTYNGTNPIVGYTVGIEFGRPLRPATIRQISALHGRFKQELPRRVEQQAITFQMGIPFQQMGVAAPSSPPAELGGVVFDSLLPDGRTRSALSVNQTAASYTTSQYTRWVEFRPVAERLLSEVGKVALSETPAKGLLVAANNRFEWGAGADFDISKLIRPEPKYVAPFVLQCLGPCHSFHGYAIPHSDPPGNRIDNIFLTVNRSAEGAAVLDLNFNLRLQMTREITDPDELFETASTKQHSPLARALLTLHELNKALLRDILLESVAESIQGLTLPC